MQARATSNRYALRKIETAAAKAATLVVVTDHREVWRAVLGHATAITYSIKDGQAELGVLLPSIPFTTAPTLPYLNPCAFCPPSFWQYSQIFCEIFTRIP